MKQTKYKSKQSNSKGIIEYSEQENNIWQELITRQMPIIEKYGCNEFIQGLKILNLPKDKIPQLPDINQSLHNSTKWSVECVPALIGFDRFFELLSKRKFPAATFIRAREELDYLQEPDIFHEIFGHCPMLTNPVYADFMQKYGEIGVGASSQQRVMLARLYWFTVEFGLIKTNDGLKVYGGGILSSIAETPYAINSDAERKQFELLEVLRTPYRIDIKQPIYYVINDYQQIYNVINDYLFDTIAEAKDLGLYPARFDKI